MRSIQIYSNNELAGLLMELSPTDYLFRYDDSYFNDLGKESISVTLPKTKQEFRSKEIFPFFINMLPEGGNRRILCRRNKVDEKDYFGMLMMMRGADFIGSVDLK